MVSPPLDPRFYLMMDGVWTDITAYVGQTKLATITRGRDSESQVPKPSTCELTLDNADDRFNPRNPLSPYFGKLRRNVPFKVTLPQGDRFYGEVPAWEPEWNEDRSLCTVPLEPSGPLRRLNQGRGNVRVPYRTYLNTRMSPVVYHYWALEDGPEAGQLKADVGGVPATLVSNRSPNQSYQEGRLAEWLPDTVAMYVNDRLDVPADIAGQFYRGWDVSLVASSTDGDQFLMIVMDCQVDSWVFTVDWATSTWTLYLPDGSVESNGVVSGELKEVGPFLIQVGGRYDGANLNWHMGVTQLYENLYGIGVGTILGRVLQPIRNMYIYSGAGTSGSANGPVAVGHIAVSERTAGPVSAELIGSWSAARGLLSERALTRFQRVCDEQGVGRGGSVTATATQRMGRQFVGTFLDQLSELERSDGGLMRESRSSATVEYIALADLYDQTPAAVLDYAAGHIASPLKPVDDDRFTRNDITGKREGGGEHRAVLLTGPMSVEPPEDGGVGRYDDDYKGNWATESQLATMTRWQLSKGTLDIARYESVTVNLMAPDVDQALYDDLMTVDVGSYLQLVNLEAANIYEPVNLMVIGYEETVGVYQHVITFTCVPYDLYRRGTIGTTFRLGSHDTVTNEVLDATETGMDTVTTGAPWTAANQPFDVMVGGERMTVTAVTGAGSAQTLTVTRSVNGVVKGHSAGTAVVLADPIYLGVV